MKKYRHFTFLFLALCLANLSQSVAQKRYAMGNNFNQEAYNKVPYKAILTKAAYEDLPAAVSYMDYCPTPGDQGNLGTCVAFATAYHFRTIMQAISLGVKDKAKINDMLYSPSFVYELIKDTTDRNCQAGTSVEVAMMVFREMGVTSLKTIPYACNPVLTNSLLPEANQAKIRDYQRLFNTDDPADKKIKSVKKALSEGFPVPLSFICPESFYTIKDLWSPAPNEQPFGKHGGHALCIIGYDDNKHGGAFQIINSWGPLWAEKGFFWVRYNDFAAYAKGAFQGYPVMDTPPSPTPTPQPAPVVVTMKGSVEFRQNTGAAMPTTQILAKNLVVEDDASETHAEDMVAYKMNQAYPSGTKFRFLLTNNKPAYVYAFATDLSKKINKILPYADGMSPLLGKDNIIAFPSETKVVKMDENKGTDYMLILFSEEELDAKKLLDAMSNAPGGLSQKIRTALGDKLIAAKDIAYSSAKVGFEVKTHVKGRVVPLMVEITHQ